MVDGRVVTEKFLQVRIDNTPGKTIQVEGLKDGRGFVAGIIDNKVQTAGGFTGLGAAPAGLVVYDIAECR